MKLRLLDFFKKLMFIGKTSKLHSYPTEFARLLDQKLSRLEKLLGYRIKDPTFYIKAITHRSFAEFSDYNLRSNERLEFLGDSVLSIIIAEYLFKDFPNEDEGFLTKTRAHLVNRAALGYAAERINLLDYMLVSNNFGSSNSKGAHSIISNAMEALIGAIYLDAGLEAATHFVEKVIINPGIKEGILLVDRNYKSRLLEFTQAHKLQSPVYKLLMEEGPHHNKLFTMEVFIENISYGNGTGKNKKAAEQNAAQDALIKIGEMKSINDKANPQDKASLERIKQEQHISEKQMPEKPDPEKQNSAKKV